MPRRYLRRHLRRNPGRPRAGALAAAVAGGIAPYLLAAAMSLVLGLGWASAVGIRARYRHSIIILLSGALAAAVSALPAGDRLTWIPAIVAVALIAIFVAELVRGEGAEHRLESTISSTAGVLAAVAALSLPRDAAHQDEDHVEATPLPAS